MAIYDTVANVVSDTAVELGLGAVSDVFGSSDSNVVQMRALLKRVGRELALMRPWVQLQKEYTFPTVNGTASYSLPADFSSMFDQSGWNRTTRFPISPISPQAWQQAKAVAIVSSLTLLIRPHESTLDVYPTPTTVQTVAFEYHSRYWVRNTGGTTLDKDAPTANTDVLMFDGLLLVAALKLAWQEAKGFDTTAATSSFLRILGLVESANANVAPVLSLNGSVGEPLVGIANLPDTGYGA